MTEIGSPQTKKRGRGRPRIHPGGMTTVSIRVPVEHAARVRSLIAAIKLIDQRPHDRDSLVLIEALEQRVASLGNRNPALAERALRGSR
jgi:hypothetical protein